MYVISVTQALLGFVTSKFRSRTFGTSSEGLDAERCRVRYPRTARILLTRIRRATRCVLQVSPHSRSSSNTRGAPEIPMTGDKRCADQPEEPYILLSSTRNRLMQPCVVAAA